MQIRFAVEVESYVKMVRPETGTIKLIIKPTEKFATLGESDKTEWLAALAKEPRFHYGRDGEVSFSSDGFEQFFTIEKESEQWEYNGGECHVLNTEYDWCARRK